MLGLLPRLVLALMLRLALGLLLRVVLGLLLFSLRLTELLRLGVLGRSGLGGRRRCQLLGLLRHRLLRGALLGHELVVLLRRSQRRRLDVQTLPRSAGLPV